MPHDYLDQENWLKLSQNPEVWSWSTQNNNFFDLRMLAIRLKDGTILLYSPIKNLSEKAFSELDSFGEVSAILAPNHFHNLGLKSFSVRYKRAKIFAGDRAKARLEQVTQLNCHPIHDLYSRLATNTMMWEPKGLKTGEVWIGVKSAEGAPLLIVSDAFFNMTRPGLSFFNLLLRLSRAAPGLKVTPVFKFIAIEDKKIYLRSATEILKELKPQILIPSHGRILFDSDLAKRLEELLP